MLANRYSKLVVSVRWQSFVSMPFVVRSAVRQGSSLAPAIFSIFINTFIIKLREVNTDCTINGVFVGCIMYADDLILTSATVNGLQTMLNCCYNVSVNLLLKFNCAKSSCFAIGKGHAFNISNMQLGNDSIS